MPIWFSISELLDMPRSMVWMVELFVPWFDEFILMDFPLMKSKWHSTIWLKLLIYTPSKFKLLTYTHGIIFLHIAAIVYYINSKHPWWPELSDKGGAREGLVSWGSFL